MFPVFTCPRTQILILLVNLSYIQRFTNKSALPTILLTGDFNLPDISWVQGVISPTTQYGNEINSFFSGHYSRE